MYIYKDKCLKKHDIKKEIPDGWTEITLPKWEELKRSWKPILTEEELQAQKIKQANRKELNQIEAWFKKTDYIELQASRGTILRDSEKYLNYLNEYNVKLSRYKELNSSS